VDTGRVPTGWGLTVREAVVLGGSIAGLLAARVLSDHAERVVIVEPDDLADGGAARPGAPQAVQLHVLLDMGRIQLERWLPGISAQFVADGAVLSDSTAFHEYLDGRRKVPVPGQELISATRPFFEARIRSRVLELENVTLLRGRADGLTFRGNRVDGAWYRPTGSTERQRLAADLVVDATGRASRLTAWLEQAGWPVPRLERMPIDLGYATGFFRRGSELPGVGVVASLPSTPGTGEPLLDGYAMARIEGDRWMVMIGAYTDRRPTKDAGEFLTRLRRSSAPPFREVAQCELVSDVTVHRVPDSRRRDFTGLARFPGGLVAVGDSVAAFNPIYGQGMSSAALHASCLSAHLRSGASPTAPAWGYFRRVRTVVDAAWELSTLGDLALPHVSGPYPPGYRAAQWYSDRLLRASVIDEEVHRRFLDVMNMRAHPRLLTRPGTMLRVARALYGPPGQPLGAEAEAVPRTSAITW
jgi:2-polyprenyl-6-methoxyphenol hydroxylase-like FAD-dependent oxidoreductase